MPLTFFAHQAPVIPLKLAWPKRFDGTALCVGAMTPDLAYPIDEWLRYQSHTMVGILIWSVPCTFVVCWAIRSWVAGTAFAQLPDLRAFRLHSYRALAFRRPPVLQTLVGAVIGAATHVLMDGFTHTERFGSRWLGFDEYFVDVPIRGEVSIARVLQYGLHIFGSLVCVLLLGHIARRRLFERWYGTEVVARARAFSRLRAAQRVVFWIVAGSGYPIGLIWSEVTSGVEAFRLIDTIAVTTALACALPICRPIASPSAVVPDR